MNPATVALLLCLIVATQCAEKKLEEKHQQQQHDTAIHGQTKEDKDKMT